MGGPRNTNTFSHSLSELLCCGRGIKYTCHLNPIAATTNVTAILSDLLGRISYKGSRGQQSPCIDRLAPHACN